MKSCLPTYMWTDRLIPSIFDSTHIVADRESKKNFQGKYIMNIKKMDHHMGFRYLLHMPKDLQ